MTGMSPTPGPWIYDARPDWTPWPGAIEIAASDGSSICWTPSGGNERANAPLLASAPDLLAALKKIVFNWDGEPEDMDEAREAIAKATA